MSFAQLDFWPGVIIVFIVFVVTALAMEKRFFQMVKVYWFYNRSKVSLLSTVLFLISVGLLLISVLDMRGPEEKVKMQTPAERTIILLDTSASMLAEDIKPSRLQKAILVAKHFARKAVGHQIAVVAFAEIQKKIVPFTTDIDLIDARLESLKNLKNHYGSSALKNALQESVQYFREIDGDARGNILVLTDGEETSPGPDLKIPKEVHVAFVGVGSVQGGRIPLDDSRGFRFGYKKDRGQEIVTKLSESFFKSVVADIGSSKYWIVTSYTLPSDEIVNFFSEKKFKAEGEQDMIIRPVMMEWLVVPALILLMISYLLKSIRVFTLGVFLFLSPVWAEEKELSPELTEKIQKLQDGELSQIERVKLADDLYKSGFKDEAITIYGENLNLKKIDKSIPPEAYLNFSTALLESKDGEKGLNGYKSLLESLKDNSTKYEEMKDIIQKNTTTYFVQSESQKNKEQQKKGESEDQGDSPESQGSNSNDDKNQKEQKNKPSEQKSKDGASNEEKKEEPEKNKDKSEQNENNNSEDDKKNKGQEKSEDESKKLPPQKIPAKLKQLMSDDRQLQMRMIENGTRDLKKRKSRESKDW